MKLDLGCGMKPIEGHVGVDLPLDELRIPERDGPLELETTPDGIVRFDLSSGIPWPWADDSVEGLFSSHCIEHLPAERIPVYRWEKQALDWRLRLVGTQDALFWFLDEAWRVTTPGGVFVLRWPALRDERTGEIEVAAFIDPTHYRFIPGAQVNYWSREGRACLGVSQYRARCNWKLSPDGFSQRRLGDENFSVLENQALLVKEP